MFADNSKQQVFIMSLNFDDVLNALPTFDEAQKKQIFHAILAYFRLKGRDKVQKINEMKKKLARETNPACPKCSEKQTIKDGVSLSKDLQRYLCKSCNFHWRVFIEKSQLT